MPDAGSFSFFPSQSRNPPFSIESCKRDVCVCVLQDDLATVMTEYRCHFTEEASNKYQTYIKSATHRSGESTPLFSPLSLLLPLCFLLLICIVQVFDARVDMTSFSFTFLITLTLPFHLL